MSTAEDTSMPGCAGQMTGKRRPGGVKEGGETRGLRVRMRKITRANYHSITCFNVGKRVAVKEEAAAAAEGEDGGAEHCGVSQMGVISPRGGQTAAMALAGSRDGPQRFMDTQVTRHEQCGHVFEDFLSFFFFFPHQCPWLLSASSG